MAENVRRYWLIVASKDHVQNGVQGGFLQANHGKAGNIKRMKKGDGVVFYSSKEKYGDEAPYQQFTAIGVVKDEELYQGVMGAGFEPYRRNIAFIESADVPIRSLIDQLSFISNKKQWGYPFRFGFFELNEQDFTIIAKAMLGDKAETLIS